MWVCPWLFPFSTRHYDLKYLSLPTGKRITRTSLELAFGRSWFSSFFLYKEVGETISGDSLKQHILLKLLSLKLALMIQKIV